MHPLRTPVIATLAGLAVLMLPAFASAQGEVGEHDADVSVASSISLPLQISTNDEGKADANTSVDLPLRMPAGVIMTASGTVAVGGAKVTATSTSSLTAQSSWGNIVLTWVVNPISSAMSALAGIKVGDLVSFTGSLNPSQSSLTVDASTIRDASATPPTPPIVRHAVLSGTVSGVAASSFTLQSAHKGSITVLTNASTTVMLNGTTTPFSSIAAGQTATVAGSFDRASSTLMASKIVIPKTKGHIGFWAGLGKKVATNLNLQF